MVRFSMPQLAEALVISALTIACLALLWDRSRMQSRLELLETRVNSLAGVVARGWKDSMNLTRFDWRMPEDRG